MYSQVRVGVQASLKCEAQADGKGMLFFRLQVFCYQPQHLQGTVFTRNTRYLPYHAVPYLLFENYLDVYASYLGQLEFFGAR